MTDTTTIAMTEATRQDRWIEAGRGWGRVPRNGRTCSSPTRSRPTSWCSTSWASGPTTHYLDVACGSGFAANIARRRGATVSGLDASETLIDIARARTPDGDFRVGDMFALPFASGSFDVVTSFNGIWNRCDDALDQARMVLADDGLLGLTYWGSHERMGLMPYFLTVIQHSPPSHQAANHGTG